jgi:hypothetical protein
LLFFSYFCPRKPIYNKKIIVVHYTSIVLLMPLIAALAIPPCLITSVRASLNFRALRERFYKEKTWFQILKTLREENKEVWELRRIRRVI